LSEAGPYTFLTRQLQRHRECKSSHQLAGSHPRRKAKLSSTYCAISYASQLHSAEDTPVNNNPDRPRIDHILVSWSMLVLHDDLRSEILRSTNHRNKHRRIVYYLSALSVHNARVSLPILASPKSATLTCDGESAVSFVKRMFCTISSHRLLLVPQRQTSGLRSRCVTPFACYTSAWS
jgi:hypothetical protein